MAVRIKAYAFHAFVLALGSAGGYIAAWLGSPIPWLMGAMAASAFMVTFANWAFPADYLFPQPLRFFFVGIIGVMIGARIHPEFLGQITALALSFGAVTLFVLIAQVGNYLIFNRLGGYDRATAWFSASPGGLIEALTMGEASGADVKVLTLQQFLRIITVITVLPLALSLYHGHPVGSAAGMSMGAGPGRGGEADIAWSVVLVLAGLGLGRLVRLPAWQLTGPLVLTGLATAMGWLALSPPIWLSQAAQVVIGVSLGTRFFGVNGRLLVKTAGMAVLSGAFMLALGAGLAWAVHALSGRGFEVMFIALAPGGVTEMALVALSLAADPAFVTLHHLYRIMLTVLFLGLARRLGILTRTVD